jgi:hypothetical protein
MFRVNIKKLVSPYQPTEKSSVLTSDDFSPQGHVQCNWVEENIYSTFTQIN